MTTDEILVLAVSAAVLLLSVAGLAKAVLLARQFPTSRFISGWLGALSLLAGLPACVGVCLSLSPLAETSALALSVVVLVNMLAQPLLLLMVYMACRKIFLGLTGRIGYGSRAIPEEELQDISAEERLSLQRYCIVQGLVLLPVAALLSAACATPLF